MQREIRTFFDLSIPYYVVAERQSVDHGWKVRSVHSSLENAQCVLNAMNDQDGGEDTSFEATMRAFNQD